MKNRAVVAIALIAAATLLPAVQASADDVCDVSSAQITWGFKESFRSYISGTIANGEWTVADGATYETPDFGFSGGVGAFDSQSLVGQIDFAGSITFTGHGGILNTTVANPSIRFDDADTAYLLLDVTGTTQDGDPVDSADVQFVRLDLTATTVEVENTTLTLTGAPAVLTEQGAAAFGTYAAGEVFDPLTVSFTTEPDCAAIALPMDDDVAVPAEPTSNVVPVWLGLGLALLAAIVVVVVVVRRRGTAS